MSDYRYRVGMGHVPSYQISGVPFATSSLEVPASSGDPKTVSFGACVTRTVTVRNTVPASEASAPMRVGFSENGVNGVEYNNYFVLDNGESFTGEWRLSKLFLLGDGASPTSGSVIAEITGIDHEGALETNWSGSVGVG